MTHSPREVYLLMSSRYLSETVLHDWSLPIPSRSSPLFKAALSFEANEHPSGSGSCRRDFCLPSVFAFFASVQSFLGLHRGVQLPLCPRKCCQEGGCEEQPWGLAGSKVSFNCAEFQGQPKRMGRGGQILGTGGSPGAAVWAWAQKELMESLWKWRCFTDGIGGTRLGDEATFISQLLAPSLVILFTSTHVMLSSTVWYCKYGKRAVVVL